VTRYIGELREEYTLAYWVFDSRAVFLVSVLVCACGGSSEGPGAGGAGGGGLGNGASGSTGRAGASAISNAGTSGTGTTSTDSTCPTFTPCGGDLLGDWTIKEVCIKSPSKGLNGVCPGMTLSVGAITATGTLSFRADHTETGSATISYPASVHIPADCYTESNCTLYETVLKAGDGVSTASCSWDTATGCSCTMNVNQALSMGSGTYEVQGTNAIFTSADSAEPSVSSFCVSGNTLQMYSASDNGVTSSLTLTR